jgi:hypothetical protein
MIGLNVRLEDMGDPHGFLLGGLEIGFDIELWIHHSAASCAPSAEEVACAAGLWGQEMPKNHRGLLLGFWSCNTPVATIGSNTYFRF